MATSTASFIDRVQALPPELFSEVFELTFTLQPEFQVSIDKHYKPPALLQVNRSFREQLSRTYYKNTIFLFFGRQDARAWLSSLTTEHECLIRKIRYDPQTKVRPSRKMMTSIPRDHTLEHDLLLEFEADLIAVTSMRINPDTGRLLGTLRESESGSSCDVKISVRFRGEDTAEWTSTPMSLLYDIQYSNLWNRVRKKRAR